ncbi:hypothetical protein EHS13_29260 [Paenibacillus psychroresistens]|uniref:alpha-L-fucosidase n=1 Tax=Paenibacillus psychroresistens TaxID=1778678 RepID=A0A6B8RSH5_9BACL|nr:discoidin domain-containing protein [Paenibacillus psychroresistens]QGQ98682.1 hypothetical protein EHS13_29260 [Paenibacillus psychroresistens]
MLKAFCSKTIGLTALVACLLLISLNIHVKESQADPANNWYTQSHYGLFSHFTYGSSSFNQTIYPNGTIPLNLNELGNNFNATQFAADVNSFGVDYVTLTGWHYAMNALYPSAKMNLWRGAGHASSHDVIQDLINALQPYGIELALYIHVTDGHDFTVADQTATGWNDSSNGYLVWNNFINDVVTEMGNRYGTGIAGYWIDMVFDGPFQTKIDKPRLRTSLLAGNSNRIIVGNGSTGDAANSQGGGTTDYTAREYYGQPADINTWTATYNQTATVMTTDGQWWASTPTGTNQMKNTAENMFRFTVLEAGVNQNGGGMLWNAGNYAGFGVLWPDGVKTGLQTLGGYINAVGASLKNVFPSTSYARSSGTTLNSLPNGIVATKATNNLIEYIHVLNPPVGKVLTLPAPSDGKTFSTPTILKNGHAVAITQNATNVTLTLGAADNWDSLDTVIRMVASGGSTGGVIKKNDTDASIAYSGTWGYSGSRNVGDYSNDVHYTTTNGNYFEYTFNSTGIDYITSKDVNYGNIDIYIDGVYKQTVSALNAGGYIPQQVLYSNRSLSPGSHTIKGIKTSGVYMQLDVLDVVTPNLALNKTVTASSAVSNSDWALAKATDGLTFSSPGSMGWSSLNSLTTNHTEWVTVDLTTSQALSKVLLYPRNDGANTGYGFPINFTIQLSTDNINWTTVATQTGYALPAGVGQSFTFSSQNARYVKINGTSLRANPNDINQYRMQFAEIVVNP